MDWRKKMNKQEAIKTAEFRVIYPTEVRPNLEVLPLEEVKNIISQIHEPQKPKVSQVAVEFYEKYKACMLSLGEWFSDFYSNEAREDFPRIEELTDWLRDNDNETNRQRELALATLVTLGIDAVEVEKEKLYTVEIPDPNSYYNYRFLSRNDIGVCIDASNHNGWKSRRENQFTEAEIKQDFEWAFQFAKPVEEK